MAIGLGPQGKCHTITPTQYCAFAYLGRSVKPIYIPISLTTIIVEEGTKAQGQMVKCFN